MFRNTNLIRNFIKRVVHGACEIFKEFSLRVELQRSNMVPPPGDGSVPPMVTFVTNYCIMLLDDDDYRPILAQVLSINQIWSQTKSHNGLLQEELRKIVEVMEINLETWAKTFEDTALSHFFLMNNYNYLQELFQESAFGGLMGDNWLKGYEQKMEMYTEAYLKQSWGKLAPILSEEDLLLFFPRGTTTQELVKRRLREFNNGLEDMYRQQSEWVVLDNGLRERGDANLPENGWYLHNFSENGSSAGKILCRKLRCYA